MLNAIESAGESGFFSLFSFVFVIFIVFRLGGVISHEI
jgi:hypothetical protein